MESKWKDFKTRFRKLDNGPKKSGSGAKQLSARNKYILTRFAFLRPYLRSRVTRSNMGHVEADEEDDEQEISDNEVNIYSNK